MTEPQPETAPAAAPEPIGPEVLTLTSDPLPVDASPEDVDQIREDLLTRLREQVTEAGWDPEDVQIMLRIDDATSLDTRTLVVDAVRGFPRTPQWHLVHTDSGYLMRLVGGDGQPILYSSREYPDPEAAQDALDLVRSSLQPVGVVSASADQNSGARYAMLDVDERENPE